jgi:UDP-galactopyranose mutase
MLKDVGVTISHDFEPAGGLPERPLMLCFSHLRWDFVFQRPQHLMTRFARTHEVHVWEEPIFEPGPAAPRLEVRAISPHLTVVTPHMPEGMDEDAVEAARRALLDEHLGAGRPQVAWYFTPMRLPFSRHIAADCTV